MPLDLLIPYRSADAFHRRWMRGGLLACALLLTACSATAPRPEAAAMQDDPGTAPCCGPITPAAQRVRNVLDQSDVEHRWLRGQHVD